MHTDRRGRFAHGRVALEKGKAERFGGVRIQTRRYPNHPRAYGGLSATPSQVPPAGRRCIDAGFFRRVARIVVQLRFDRAEDFTAPSLHPRRV